MLSLSLIQEKRILKHHRCQTQGQVAEKFLTQGKDGEKGSLML